MKTEFAPTNGSPRPFRSSSKGKAAVISAPLAVLRLGSWTVRLLPPPIPPQYNFGGEAAVESSKSKAIRFGVFEVDLRVGELRKDGLKVRLQEQPFSGAGFAARETRRGGHPR